MYLKNNPSSRPGRHPAPSAAHASAVLGPETIARVVFANGITVLVRENHAAPVAVLQGTLRAGAMHETGIQAGLASLTAGMLSRGSQRYDFDAFNDVVEGAGANLTFGADTDSTDFGITCLSEDFAPLVEVLADALRRPLFPADQFEKLRRQRLVYLRERDQDTGSVASLQFHEALFGRDHPYGRATSGYVETLETLQLDELVAFHAQRFTPQGAILVVTGDVETASVLDLLQRHFGDWEGPMPERTFPPLIARTPGEPRQIVMADKVQSDLVIGAPAIRREDPDFYAVRVANCILGQFGLMGRLGERVREEQGLAYYAYSSVVAEQIGGVWMASAGVNPEHVEQAAASIAQEFARLGAEPVPADEVADSQSYLTGVLPLMLETNEGVASTLLSMEWNNLGLDYLQRYPELIRCVTAEDIQRVARTYLDPARCTVVVAGPDPAVVGDEEEFGDG
jgi:zinc protease